MGCEKNTRKEPTPELILTVYGVLFFINIVMGMFYSNYVVLGSCNKPSTNIGFYSGLSTAYDLGCKLGKRREQI